MLHKDRSLWAMILMALLLAVSPLTAQETTDAPTADEAAETEDADPDMLPPEDAPTYEIRYEREVAVGDRFTKTGVYRFEEQLTATVGERENVVKTAYAFEVIGRVEILAAEGDRVTDCQVTLAHCRYQEDGENREGLPVGTQVRMRLGETGKELLINGDLQTGVAKDPRDKRIRRMLELFAGVTLPDDATANTLFRPHKPMPVGEDWGIDVIVGSDFILDRFPGSMLRRVKGKAKLHGIEMTEGTETLKLEQVLEFVIRDGEISGLAIEALARKSHDVVWVPLDPTAAGPTRMVGRMVTQIHGSLQRGDQTVQIQINEVCNMNEKTVVEGENAPEIVVGEPAVDQSPDADKTKNLMPGF